MKSIRTCACWMFLLLVAVPAAAQVPFVNVTPSPGDRLAYVSATDSDQVWVFDMDTPGWVAQIDVGAEPRGLDVAPDNGRVYVANRFGGTVGTISVIDTATLLVVTTIDLDVPAVSTIEPYDVAVSPDGTRLYVAMKNGGSDGDNAGGIVAVDLTDDSVIAEILTHISGTPEGIAVTPDGSKVYVAGRNGLFAFDATNLTFIGEVGNAGRELVISPDGAWVYAANNIIRTADDTAFPTTFTMVSRGGVITPDGAHIFGSSGLRISDITAGDPPVVTDGGTFGDSLMSSGYGIDLTDEGDLGLVSTDSFIGKVRLFRTDGSGAPAAVVEDTALAPAAGGIPVFDGDPVTMEIDAGEGSVIGSGARQLVIAHSTPDLEVSVVADVDTAQPGDTVSYTLTVTNNGHGTARDVVISDTLPAGLTFASASDSGSASGQTVTWPAIATPAEGATATRTVTATVDSDASAGDTDNTATVTTPNDPVAANDTAAVTTSVELPPPPPAPVTRARRLQGNGCQATPGAAGGSPLDLLLLLLPLAVVVTRRRLWLSIALVSLLGASAAQAVEGIEAQRLRPPVDGNGTFTLYDSHPLAPGEVAFGGLLSYARDPVVVGDERGRFVNDRLIDLLSLELTAAYGVVDGVDVGVRLPVHYLIDGKSFTGVKRVDAWRLGDVEIEAKIRLVDSAKAAVGLALVPTVGLPTGDKVQLLGLGTFSYGARLVMDGALGERARWIANAGWRAVDGVGSGSTADFIDVGLGVVAPVGGGAQVVAEVNSRTTTSHPWGDEESSPVELLVGGRGLKVGGLSLAGGLGWGLDKGVGAPEWRAFIGVTF